MAIAQRRLELVNRNRIRRKVAQDLTAFRPLIDTPAPLGSTGAPGNLSAFTWPANGELAVRLNAPTETGDITVLINDRVVTAPAGDAGRTLRLGYVERARSITVQRGATAPAGAVEVLVLDEWRQPFVVATGTFTG